MRKRLLIVIIASMLLLGGCGSSKITSGIYDYEHSWDEYVAYEIVDDQWVYYVEKTQTDEGTNYDFDAVNLKYSYLEDYSWIPVYDSNGEQVDGFLSSIPYLLIGKNERTEMGTIEDHLVNGNNDYQYQYVNIDLFAKLYDSLKDISPLEDGKIQWAADNIVKEQEFIDGYEWQIGYFSRNRVILAVQIETILSIDGESINASDVKESNETYQQLCEKNDELEQIILETQQFVKSDYQEKIGEFDYSRLYKLISNYALNYK